MPAVADPVKSADSRHGEDAAMLVVADQRRGKPGPHVDPGKPRQEWPARRPRRHRDRNREASHKDLSERIGIAAADLVIEQLFGDLKLFKLMAFRRRFCTTTFFGPQVPDQDHDPGNIH